MSLTLTAPRVDAPSAKQVALQLAKVEARRVALHPATLVGLALAIWTMWGLNWGEAPVLNRAGANTSLPLVLIGAGGLIAVSAAAVRMWKTEQSEAIDIAPASPRTRTVALLAAATIPVLAALVLQFTVLGLMMLDRPVTGLDWSDTIAGPATVALLAVAGVAAGRWFPSRFTGPLLLVVLLGASIYVGTYDVRQRNGEWTKWLAPIVPLEFDPVELEFRPTGVHLIYLTGLIAVFASLAVLRGRAKRVWIPVMALLVSLAVVGGSAGAQAAAYRAYDPDRQLQSYLLPEADYVCQERSGVRYCAYPGYDPWIAEWAALVEPVLDMAPSEVRDQKLEVRQYPLHALDVQSNDPAAGVEFERGLATGMWWGRDPGGAAGTDWGDGYPFGMALGAASWAVGLSSEPVAGVWEQTYGPDGEVMSIQFVPSPEGDPPEDVSYQACTTHGQARAVVALWMAAKASPVTEQHLRNQIENPPSPLIEEFQNPDGTIVYGYQGLNESMGVGQAYPWFALDFQMWEAYYAYLLLDQPQPEVLAAVRANWGQLIDPNTTTLAALSILEVEPLQDFESTLAESGDFFQQYPPCL